MKRKIIIMTVILVALAFVVSSIKPLLDAHVANEAAKAEAAAENLSPCGPDFSVDSAYVYVSQQCGFGPRIMNSTAHDKCGKWIVAKFQEMGCIVEEQQAQLTGYDGTVLNSTNIIAHLNPEATNRILICAHWDSRPWADNDPDTSNHHTPIIAANDAASGVAVMIELARLLSNDSTSRQGIDFVCFDAEDWGTPQWSDVPDRPDTWALGAQYYADHLSNPDFQFGILLDMVGGQGAQFYREMYSTQYAPDVVKKIWKAARRAGFGSFFPKRDGGMVTDDHVPLCKRGIPMVDIIPYYPDCRESSFGPTWHTVNDNLEHIDKSTLKAVGQTLIQFIYEL